MLGVRKHAKAWEQPSTYAVCSVKPNKLWGVTGRIRNSTAREVRRWLVILELEFRVQDGRATRHIVLR